MAHDKVFPDGLAPPKRVAMAMALDNTKIGEEEELEQTDKNSSNSNNKNSNNQQSSSSMGKRKDHTSKQQQQKQQQLLVEQKAWVKSMVRCFIQQQDSSDTTSSSSKNITGNVGIELLEASFADLNPRNLRKIRQLGEYHYDPGKYTSVISETSTAKSSSTNAGTRSHVVDTTAPKIQTQVQETKPVNPNDELDAPWNQYAWMEELSLRVSAKCIFVNAYITYTVLALCTGQH